MNDSQFGAILEDIDHKMDVEVEAVGQLQNQVNDLPTRGEFNELKSDVQVIKQVVTEQEQRLNQLETTN